MSSIDYAVIHVVHELVLNTFNSVLGYLILWTCPAILHYLYHHQLDIFHLAATVKHRSGMYHAALIHFSYILNLYNSYMYDRERARES